MKRGDVWWTSFDPSTGSEIRKTRPAVIISTDVSNNHMRRVTVLPLTSNTSRVYPAETVVSVNNRLSKVMADQIGTADKSRLKTFICRLTDEEMSQVDEAIKLHLGL